MTGQLFEGCDSSTMTVFNSALDEARHLGHNYVGTEHLLLALVRHRDVLPETVAALLPSDPNALALRSNRSWARHRPACIPKEDALPSYDDDGVLWNRCPPDARGPFTHQMS